MHRNTDESHSIDARYVMRYSETMIKDFKHKGLEEFFVTNSTQGIQSKHRSKLRFQLAMLNAAAEVDDMNKPGWNLHQLKGQKAGIRSIKVSGNWRMTFAFREGDAYIVNYEDYH